VLCGGQVLRATVNKSLRDMDKKLTNVSNVIYNLILLLIVEDQSPGGADSAAGLVASLAGALYTDPPALYSHSTLLLLLPRPGAALIVIDVPSGDVRECWYFMSGTLASLLFQLVSEKCQLQALAMPLKDLNEVVVSEVCASF
jgi:hypothetical protein